MQNRLIALFDMDDTLCDTMGQLRIDLSKVVSNEELLQFKPYENSTHHIREKRKEIMSKPGWWRDLPKLKAGFDILNITRELGYENYIVTKGPAKLDLAFTEKRQWQKRETPDLKFIITDDKSIIEGNVLIDDWPPYLESWLKYHPNGKAIMPLNSYNLSFEHPKILKYDSTNISEVRAFLEEIKIQSK